MDSPPSKKRKEEADDNTNSIRPLNLNEAFRKFSTTATAIGDDQVALAAAEELVAALKRRRQQDAEDASNQLSGTSSSSSNSSAGTSVLTPVSDDDEQVAEDHPEWYALTESDDEVISKVINAIANTPELRSRICFDLGRFVRNLVARYREGADVNGNDIPFLFVGGRTQVGKTVVKVITLMIGYLLGFSTVIVTTLNSNRGDLASKCVEYTRLLDSNLHFKGLSTLIVSGAGKANKFILKSNGGMIIAVTAAQCENTASMLMELAQEDSRFRYVIVLDECDAMWRTKDNVLKLEQGLEKLVFGQAQDAYSSLSGSSSNSISRFLKPAIVVNISATIMPTLFLTDERFKGVTYDSIEDVHELIGTDDYVGFNMQIPFQLNGTNQFLQPKELNKANRYWSPLAEEFYRSALRPENKMTLILDICNSRVNAEVNIYDRAEMIQEIFQDQRLIIFCVSGSAIDVYDNGNKGILEDHKNKSKLGEYIERYDKYPNLPVIIIGYSQMIRGISYRSGERIPTHILNFMGTGKSIEDLIQSRGRATGNFKKKLESYGYTHITLLTTEEDYSLPFDYSDALDKMKSNGNGSSSRFNNIHEIGAMIRIMRGKRGIGPKKLDIHGTLAPRIPEEVIDVDEESEEDDNNQNGNQTALDFVMQMLENNKNGCTKEQLKEKYQEYNPNSKENDDSEEKSSKLINSVLNKLVKAKKVKLESKIYKKI